jgi:hypothetical protein
LKQLEEQVLAIQAMVTKYNHNHGANGQFSTGDDAHTVSGGAGSGTHTLGPKHPNYVAPAKVQVDAAAQQKLTEWFDKELSNSEIAGLAGAPPGTVVKMNLANSVTGKPFVEGDSSEPNVRLRVAGGGVFAERNIQKPYPGLPVTIENSFLSVEASQQGNGIGTKMFVTEVDQAAALGVSKITTDAAQGMGFNGYYTWARLGYDKPLHSYSRKPEWAPDVSSMIDLMAIPATADHPSGASWWKANGREWSATFDLTPGSRSLQILHAYADARGIAHKAKDGMAAEKPKNDKGEEIPWSDEDEAIAEQVWQTLAKQWEDGKGSPSPVGSGKKQLERSVQEIEGLVASFLKYNHEHGPNGQFGVTESGGGGGGGISVEEKIQKLATYYDPHVQKLSEEKQLAIGLYSNIDAGYYNGQLRSGFDKYLTEQGKKNIQSIQDAALSMETPFDFTVTRGITDMKIPGMKIPPAVEPVFQQFQSNVGKTFVDPAFGSSTLYDLPPSHIVQGKAGILIHIDVPKGAHGMYIESIAAHKGEHEFLIPHSSTYTVVSAAKNDTGQYVVHLKLHGPSGKSREGGKVPTGTASSQSRFLCPLDTFVWDDAAAQSSWERL